MTQPKKDTLVIKVGTSTLTKQSVNGLYELDQAAFSRIGEQIMKLKTTYDIVIVSSGAITAGLVELRETARPDKTRDMPKLQMLASLGNHHLVTAWRSVLPSVPVGSLLLTRHNLDDNASERSNAVHVIRELHAIGGLPVINENDAVTNEEIAYGDNDTLAAIVAARLVGPDHTVKLVLLSDVDGVYVEKHDPTTRIAEIAQIEEYEHLAGEAGSANGTGGMATKFAAARIATKAGVEMWVANGSRPDGVLTALSGQSGTHFIA